MSRRGKDIGRPAAILVVSAHCLTPNETRVTVHARPNVGNALSALRDKSVLILASGNVVHKLRQTDGWPPFAQ